MTDKIHQARVAALSIAQCSAVIHLLRAHGETEHAECMETAISMVASIVSNELGSDALADAVNWVSHELGQSDDLSKLLTTRH